MHVCEWVGKHINPQTATHYWAMAYSDLGPVRGRLERTYTWSSTCTSSGLACVQLHSCKQQASVHAHTAPLTFPSPLPLTCQAAKPQKLGIVALNNMLNSFLSAWEGHIISFLSFFPLISYFAFCCTLGWRVKPRKNDTSGSSATIDFRW